MASVERSCEWCKTSFQARSADVKRGWARFCCKSCKAAAQEYRTNGQYRRLTGGVPKEKFLEYASEYGGIPQFSGSGEYIGFTGGGCDQD